MASNITTSSIDELFPVAGEDNDSQGFRDNFRIIKDGLATAADEITTLQSDTAKLNDENDFNGNVIRNAVFINNSNEAYISDTVSVSQDILWTNGEYQIFTLSDDVTLTTTGWPESGKLGRMWIGIKSDGINRVCTFAASGTGIIKVSPGWKSLGNIPTASVAATSDTDLTFINMWSNDGGLTVYATLLGKFEV